jgi:hypothetical protein
VSIVRCYLTAHQQILHSLDVPWHVAHVTCALLCLFISWHARTLLVSVFFRTLIMFLHFVLDIFVMCRCFSAHLLYFFIPCFRIFSCDLKLHYNDVINKIQRPACVPCLHPKPLPYFCPWPTCGHARTYT